MTDTGPDPDPGTEPAAAPSEPAPASAMGVSRRTLGISLALLALVAVIAVEVSYILSAAHPSGGPAPSASTARAPIASEAAFSAPAPSVSGAAAAELFQDDIEPPAKIEPQHAERVLRGTVRDAAARSCSTSSVDGLSRQIIAQTRCIDAKAFVAVPPQPNLRTGPNVFLYLEASAKDQLVRALQANRKATMTVNSALRTVAQQYLLRRWAAGNRCGIEIASLPGESNHETGLALDIAEPGTWRSALEAQDFRWLGSIDRVHFDFKGPRASSRASVDVKAFQQLWNLNHAEDLLVVNGQYGAATEERLEKSPARGFPLGPRCAR